MRRHLAALLAAAAVGALVACDAPSPTQPSTTSSNSTATGSRPVPTPIVEGPGAADMGIKWNWNLKPPLDYARTVGWGDTFFEVEWCAVRDLPAGRKFASVERILGMAQDMGYRLMIKIRVGGCQGEGEVLDPAEGTRKSPSGYPDDPAAYQAFVTGLVTRYSQLGVTSYAIENEVDANNFWRGTPQEYVDTVKLAADAIKKADPDATILDAGISSTGYGISLAGDLMDAGKDEEALTLYRTWYERRASVGNSRFPLVDTVDELRSLLTEERATRVRDMVAANWEAVNSGSITAYQLHFYENPTLLPTLLAYIDGHLRAPLPIQAWEIGTAWPGDGYTPETHAAETAQLLGTLLARKASPVVYLPLAFTPGPGKVEVFRGLVSPEGQEQPAGAVYRQFAAAARTSTAVVPISLEGGEGVLLVGGNASFASVWPTGGGSLSATGQGVRAADVPNAATSGPVDKPLLIDVPATDEGDALAHLTTTLGTTVTAS